jgi:hypothetical protein
MPAFAQRAETVPLKNWALQKSTSGTSPDATRDTSSTTTVGLTFIAIAPCRLVDTRTGSANSGSFGSPSLLGGQPRVIPVPQSPCGAPSSTAYSLNFISITPAGQSVGYVSAWQDNLPWPGTVVLNALLGGVVDNSAVVASGPDGGIQIMASNNADLVIDINGYYTRAAGGPQGPAGPQGPQGVPGPAGLTGSIGPAGATGPAGAAGPTGLTGSTGSVGPAGAIGLTGLTGPAGPVGPFGPAGLMGLTGPAGPAGAAGTNGAAGAPGGSNTLVTGFFNSGVPGVSYANFFSNGNSSEGVVFGSNSKPFLAPVACTAGNFSAQAGAAIPITVAVTVALRTSTTTYPSSLGAAGMTDSGTVFCTIAPGGTSCTAGSATQAIPAGTVIEITTSAAGTGGYSGFLYATYSCN